jgi:hypothetical protein
MKKIFPLLLLLLLNLSHAQSWEFVAVSSTGEFYFIDPESIKKYNSEIRFTQLSNHPNGFQYDSNVVYSIVTYRTANCEKVIYKSGFLFGYPELNAQGGIEVIDLKHDSKWISVKEGSMASFMQNRVCPDRYSDTFNSNAK